MSEDCQRNISEIYEILKIYSLGKQGKIIPVTLFPQPRNGKAPGIETVFFPTIAARTAENVQTWAGGR